ncbi:MAG: Re/Si-specific NAD(P)(+) transhydrogenase subunit alpha [Pyrinomonadaceae bacterium]|nr:Re/Si-specific NAD(P)(+) transhydrogenase subunit alpha [Pyrinomonadaceae bacterium]
MQIGVPKELHPDEKRVSLVPKDVKKLVRLGIDVSLENGLGARAGFSDAEYKEAGASMVADRDSLLNGSDLVLRLRKPSGDEISKLKKGSTHVSFLDPFNESELIENFRSNEITAISMEMIPRTTLAQKMDALSSQANLAGYVMVILACQKLPSILPMMMTPAGTLKPATVFVIGAGVAGLQAIATSKRLGAKVIAFDTRAVVAEQVQSLGAKFLEIDLGETAQTKDGYAVELTPEQIELQKQGQKKQIAESDVVITTAQLFGRKPPLIIPKDMVSEMKPGSVIVDMAAENGGNVEGSVAGETVELDGVTIIGDGNWTNFVAKDASVMYSSNLFNLIDEFWDKEEKTFNLDFENEIVAGCVITDKGEIVNETIRKLK